MHCLRTLLLALCLGLAGASQNASAGASKIIKVLPHYLDKEGHASVSPSLYERDGYQADLRRNLKACSGLRFDVQWKTPPKAGANLKLRVEVLGGEPKSAGVGTPGRAIEVVGAAASGDIRTTKAKPVVVETPVRARTGWSRWTPVLLTGEGYQKAGAISSWRVTLWDGDRLLAEQKSFLW